MRLIVDLRFSTSRPELEPDDRCLGLSDFAPLLRRPRELLRTLRGKTYTEVVILRDRGFQSGVQAVVAALAACSRSKSFIETGPGALCRRRPQLRLLLSLAACAAIRLPAEIIGSMRLLRTIEKATARPDSLCGVAGLSSVAYVRAEPALSYLGQQVGGAAAHTTGVINGFVDSGLEVSVFAPEKIAGIRAQRTEEVALSSAYHLVYWLTVTGYGEVLAEHISQRPVDFVYQRYALGSYAGIAAAERLQVPLVVEFNGSEVWATQHWGNASVPLATKLLALEQANLFAAFLVVVVSDVLKQQVIELGVPAERVLANPNGVDVDGLAAYRARSAEQWRAALDLVQAPTIGFVGTFGLWHGVKELPTMVELLAEACPSARWVLIGDGALFAEVKQEIEQRGLRDRVLMTGIVARERALELLSACDVCVSPHVPNPDGTPFFGSPTKLFEYMGLAKPIVASDLEQIGEVIEDERNGLLCSAGDSQAQVGAIARLLSDQDFRLRLAAQALADAESTYSWTAHVQRILAALEQLSHSQRRFRRLTSGVTTIVEA